MIISLLGGTLSGAAKVAHMLAVHQGAVDFDGIAGMTGNRRLALIH